jgi:hypothetical protein
MSTPREHLTTVYTEMTEAAQIVFLARMLLRLNLLARGTYAVGDGVEDAVMLRKFNEAQNRIESQLIRLLLSDGKRYPDDVFANIIADQFELLGISTRTAAEIIESSRAASSAGDT